MLLIAAATGTVNMLFRNGKAPKLLNNYYCYYTPDDMGDIVPAGSLVIAEESKKINTQEIVLYRNPQNEYRIAVASLIVDSSSTESEQTAKTYYLTTMTNATAVETSEDAIVGICRTRSAGLGLVIGKLISLPGLIVGLVLPLVILLLYLIAVAVKSRDHEMDFDDEDTDLAFVKSIQQKQQKIAERDAERIAKERKKTQTFDDAFYDDNEEKPSKLKQHERMSDEEIAQLEEEEAARRAERIAAVRTHMEQRRQTETPDGVPLYTTEIITKTHTLSIPKVGDQPLTTAQQPLKPTPTEDIPRLTATGHIQIPSAAQIEEERIAQENRLRHAAALAKAAQDAAFGDAPAMEKPAVRKAETVEEILNGGKAADIPAEQPAPEPMPKPEPQKAAEPAPESAAKTADEPAAKAVKKTVKKVVRKPQIKSSSFGDLMEFLDNEQKKL